MGLLIHYFSLFFGKEGSWTWDFLMLLVVPKRQFRIRNHYFIRSCEILFSRLEIGGLMDSSVDAAGALLTFRAVCPSCFDMRSTIVTFRNLGAASVPRPVAANVLSGATRRCTNESSGFVNVRMTSCEIAPDCNILPRASKEERHPLDNHLCAKFESCGQLQSALLTSAPQCRPGLRQLLAVVGPCSDVIALYDVTPRSSLGRSAVVPNPGEPSSNNASPSPSSPTEETELVAAWGVQQKAPPKQPAEFPVLLQQIVTYSRVTGIALCVVPSVTGAASQTSTAKGNPNHGEGDDLEAADAVVTDPAALEPAPPGAAAASVDIVMVLGFATGDCIVWSCARESQLQTFNKGHKPAPPQPIPYLVSLVAAMPSQEELDSFEAPPSSAAEGNARVKAPFLPTSPHVLVGYECGAIQIIALDDKGGAITRQFTSDFGTEAVTLYEPVPQLGRSSAGAFWAALVTADGILNIVHAVTLEKYLRYDHTSRSFGRCLAVQWSHDGRKLFVGGEDDAVTCLRVETHAAGTSGHTSAPYKRSFDVEIVGRLAHHRSWISGLAVLRCTDSESLLLVSSNDGNVSLWHVQDATTTPRESRDPSVARGHAHIACLYVLCRSRR